MAALEIPKSAQLMLKAFGVDKGVLDALSAIDPAQIAGQVNGAVTELRDAFAGLAEKLNRIEAKLDQVIQAQQGEKA